MFSLVIFWIVFLAVCDESLTVNFESRQIRYWTTAGIDAFVCYLHVCTWARWRWSSNSLSQVNVNKRWRDHPSPAGKIASAFPFSCRCCCCSVTPTTNRENKSSSPVYNPGAFSYISDTKFKFSRCMRLLCTRSVTISSDCKRCARMKRGKKKERDFICRLYLVSTSRLISAQGHQSFWHFSGGINIEPNVPLLCSESDESQSVNKKSLGSICSPAQSVDETVGAA